MPETTSIFTQVPDKVAGFIMELREEARKTRPVPFMEKRVPLRDARRQWATMPPEQRREYIKAHGVEAALKLVRPRGFAGATEE
mgnify:FL=1